MIEPVIIRTAALTDAPRLAELSEVLGYPASSAAIGQRLVHLLGRAEETVLVAEVVSGQVIGWVHGSEQELLESGRRCEILGLVVDAEHRDRGVGRQLIAAVEQWAVSRRLEQIAVRSNVLRADSHPFYERLGYVRTKTQHAYGKRLSGEGAV
jgi:GNAT superfamily N-acetyltransferase